MSAGGPTGELSSEEEMGGGLDHGDCEFPGCPEPAVETWYALNPEAPPPLLRASLCLEHHLAAPEDTERFARWVLGLRAQQQDDYEQHVD